MLPLQKIHLKLRNANHKLFQHFPNDPKSDIQIISKGRTFHLQKAHLRLESQYFNLQFNKQNHAIQIFEDFDEQSFYNVLSLFYGNIVQIQSGEFKQYYKIILFIGIDCLKQIVRLHIIRHLTNYDIFKVFATAYQTQDQEIFKLCLDELQKEHFQQLDFNRHEFLKLNQGLFKLVLKSYANFKSIRQKRPNQSKINELIEQYCDYNQQSQGAIQDMKYECIRISLLKAEEFKQLFLMSSRHFKNYEQISAIYSCSSGCLYQSISYDDRMHEFVNRNAKINHQLKLYNIYLKKKTVELQLQNNKYKRELQNLLVFSLKNSQIQQELQDNLRSINQSLYKELKVKRQKEIQNKKTISKFQNILESVLEELDKKIHQVNRLLLDKVNSIIKIKNSQQKRRECSSLIQEQVPNSASLLVVSQFLPATFIVKVMSQGEDQSSFQQQNSHSIQSYSQNFNSAYFSDNQSQSQNQIQKEQSPHYFPTNQIQIKCDGL